LTDMEEFLAWAVVVVPAVCLSYYWLTVVEKPDYVHKHRSRYRHDNAGKIGLAILVICIWSMVWGFDWK
jgi:hypothetical protein